MGHYFHFAASEQGSNHKKVNKVCQDASGQDWFDDVYIIAVSDGHGGDDYIRTDRGSRFAVEETISAFKEMVTSCRYGKDSLENNTQQKIWDIQNYILKKWYKRVSDDLVQEPIQESELEKVSDRYRERYQHEEYRVRAYGATLLAVCVMKDFWFGLQIGDGRCIRLCSDGRVDEPIPWDDNCEMNITTSICDSNAMEEFRCAYGRDVPAAIFIGSDGIDDSYCSDEELYELYESIFQVFIEHGEEDGIREIREYLPKLTKMGSGDDVSIAGLIDNATAMNVLERIKDSRKLKEINATIEQLEKVQREENVRLTEVEMCIRKSKAECQALENKQGQISAELHHREDQLHKKKEQKRMLEEKLNSVENVQPDSKEELDLSVVEVCDEPQMKPEDSPSTSDVERGDIDETAVENADGENNVVTAVSGEESGSTE